MKVFNSIGTPIVVEFEEDETEDAAEVLEVMELEPYVVQGRLRVDCDKADATYLRLMF